MQAQERQLPRGLHPFGHHLQVKALGQCQDGAHNGRVVGIGEHIAHEALVDLDLVEWQPLEIAQAGVAGAKVVQRKSDAFALELPHACNGVFDVAQQQAFGEFELEFGGVGAAVRQRLQHAANKARLAKLACADIHGDRKVARGFVPAPALQLFARGLQHKLAQRQNQAGLLGQGNEVTGADHAALWVTPAHQRLHTDQAGVVVHHGLVVHAQRATHQPLAQVGLQVGAGVDGGLHVRVEEALGVAARRLGLVHGQVGPFEQLVHRQALVAKQGDADAGGAVVLLPPQVKGQIQAGQEFFGNDFSLAGGVGQLGVQGFEHDHEFVTAKTCHGVGLAQAAEQPGGHLGQKLVAHVVAQGVVQVLEVVQVDEQQGAELQRACAGSHRALQPIEQHAPVGQARERVVKRQALDLSLGAFALGDVHGEAVAHHRAIVLAVGHRIGDVPAHAAVGHENPVLTLPGHQSTQRDRRGVPHMGRIFGHDAPHQHLKVTGHILGVDPHELAYGITDVLHAAGAIGVQPVFVDEPRNAAGDAPDKQQLLAQLLGCAALVCHILHHAHLHRHAVASAPVAHA